MKGKSLTAGENCSTNKGKRYDTQTLHATHNQNVTNYTIVCACYYVRKFSSIWNAQIEEGSSYSKSNFKQSYFAQNSL